MQRMPIVILLLIFSLLQSAAAFSQETKTLADEVDILYAQWRVEYESVIFSSSSYDYFKQPSFQEIVKKGIPAISLLVRKAEENPGLERLCIYQAVESILRMRFDRDQFAFNSNDDSLQQWWETGRFETEKRFDDLYEQWIALDDKEKFKKPFTFDWEKEYADEWDEFNAALKRHNELPEEQRKKETFDFNAYLVEYHKAKKRWKEMPEGAEKERLRPYNRTIYQRLLDMGIPALPFAIQKINDGDLDLFEAIHLWNDSALIDYAKTREKVWETLSSSEQVKLLNQWWEENQKDYALPGKFAIDPTIIKAMSQ
ncbi:hypothetical protein K8I31_15100 [bacterium]|nr:hypothetical protein [bacterium]